jgi:hypothetical protein
MEVDEPGRRKLGIVARKCFIETALVVIVPVSGGAVFTANINDNVAGFEKSGITGTNEKTRLECRELAEEIDCEGLVGMEVAAVKRSVLAFRIRRDRQPQWVLLMSTNSDRRCLQTFYGGAFWCHACKCSEHTILTLWNGVAGAYS